MALPVSCFFAGRPADIWRDWLPVWCYVSGYLLLRILFFWRAGRGM